MKDKLTIRISDSLKTKLSEKSETENVSVSEVARTILENHFASNLSFEKNSNFKVEATYEEDLTEEVSSETNHEEGKGVLFSKEFYQLLIWMYDQKESRDLKLSKKELETFKNTVNKIQFSEQIPNELKIEFDKVYIDLVGMLSSDYKWKSIPDFAYCFRLKGFNYKMLNNFLFPKRITINVSGINNIGYD